MNVKEEFEKRKEAYLAKLPEQEKKLLNDTLIVWGVCGKLMFYMVEQRLLIKIKLMQKKRMQLLHIMKPCVDVVLFLKNVLIH